MNRHLNADGWAGLFGVVGILYGDVAAVVDLHMHASDFLAGLVDRDAVFDIHAGVLLVELRYIIAAGIGYTWAANVIQWGESKA